MTDINCIEVIRALAKELEMKPDFFTKPKYCIMSEQFYLLLGIQLFEIDYPTTNPNKIDDITLIVSPRYTDWDIDVVGEPWEVHE